MPAHGVPMEPIDMRGVQDEPWRNLPLAWALPVSVARAAGMMRRFAPSVVLGTGGYITAPVGMAALLRRVPLVLQEQNVVPGRTTRTLARRARLVCTAFAETAARLPGVPTEHTGTPLREEFAAAGREARLRPAEERRDLRRLVVVGGSQGAHRINTAVAEALKTLLEVPGLHVHHVCGKLDIDHLAAMRGGLEPEMRERYVVEEFNERLLDVLRDADLVVSRAGGSAIAEVTALGVPLILVPYPHAGAHQRYNAEPVARAGAATVVPDEELSGVRLADEVGRLARDPALLARMRRASLDFGRPDAAREVARRVLEVGA
ncbi:MAG: UDP-N-acetylglucosamine--N-acetylmuramyl-(pentapeptide) pyrophosphoryl-undecaprenol [Chloroflexota bacterium]|nr:UDP-N-acetylglucosamine--N-acetylmuramyl-(pentapeptide) pyrophosphoryl-undecaprenol [Chloroflexota bacterium]